MGEVGRKEVAEGGRERFFFFFPFCGEFTQKGPSDPWSAEHIPAG